MGGLCIMTKWNARCFLGNEAGYQNLQVDAETWNGAKQQFERIYGSQQTINIEEAGSYDTGGSGMGAIEGLTSLLFWVGAFLVFMYWKWILGIALVFGILWFSVWLFEQKENKK